MKRPNPVKGKTVVHQNPNLVFTREDMHQAIIRSRLDGKREYMTHLGVTELNSNSTPAYRWRLENEKDSFPELINKERGSLVLGNHTDDELANELFLYGDMSLEEKHRAMIEGKCTSIAYLTAGKERIRWLARHLEASLASEEKIVAELKEVKENSVNKETLWNYLLEDHLERLQDVPNNDLTEQDKQDSSFINRAYKLLGKAYTLNKVEALYELHAISIYNRWSDQPEFRPWVNGGNATKQGKARVLARNEHLRNVISLVNKSSSTVNKEANNGS